MGEPELPDLGTVVVRSDEIVAAEMNHETVMMCVGSGRYFHLDSVGSDIWALLEQPRSVADLVHRLREEYDAPEDECRRDTQEFLGHLIQRGILRVVDGPPAP